MTVDNTCVVVNTFQDSQVESSCCSTLRRDVDSCSDDIETQKLVSRNPTPKLISFNECPEYLKDNDYIRGGYRAHFTYQQARESLFYLHNEFLNVWTHLLGSLFCFCFLIYTWTGQANLEAVGDKILLTVYICMGIYTLFFSSMFHLHICVSKKAYEFWGCLDFSGISASLAAGSISLTYLLFHCQTQLRTTLLVLLILVNSVGIVGPMFQFWMLPSFRIGRVIAYVSSGLVSLAPVIYFLSKNGVSSIPQDAAIGLASMLSQYLIGALVYSARFPECLSPGTFDVWFNSHTIFHIFCVTASYTLWTVLVSLIAWSHSSMCT